MATVTKPIALDESINTTEQTPRNIADVLAEELKGIADNILPPNASQIAYDNTASGLTATNVQDAIDEVISSQADVIADTMADLTENKTATVTDGVADFETIDGSLVKSLVVEIEPSQSGSGTPSPDNIRPITGWTQEDVTVVGKNFYNALSEVGSWVKQRCTAVFNGDGSITATNTQSGGTTWLGFISTIGNTVNINSCPCSKGDSFIITSGNNTVCTSITVGEVDSSKVLLKSTDITSGATYTVTEDDTTAIVLRFTLNLSNGATGTIYPMIRKTTNTDSAYEPYHGKTYTTPFNQTVYVGTLDVLTGELTVTHGYVDLGSLTWNQASTSTSGKNRFTASITPSPKPSPTNTSVPDLTCSHYETVSPSNTYNCIDGITVTTTGIIAIYDDTLATVNSSDFKTAMNRVQLVYELETPTTISLTPQTVKSLVGENHISASTGDVLECKFSMLINGDDLAQIIGG